MENYTDEILPDGGTAAKNLEQWDYMRPQPGYQGVPSTLQPSDKARQWYFLEPSRRKFPGRESQAFRNEVNIREKALYSPRIGWYYPAYMRFLGSDRSSYPPGFAMTYGSGPRPDHYYPGLTPKDVILAKSRRKGVTRPGFEAPRPLRNHEVMQSRMFLDAMTAIFYEGYLPSNEDLFYFLDNFIRALEDQPRNQQLSPETFMILEDLYNMAIQVREFLMQVNYDEIVQNLIHHSILAGRTAAEQARRARHRAEALGRFGDEEMEQEQAAIKGAGIGTVRMLFNRNFQRVFREMFEIVRELGEGGGMTQPRMISQSQPYVSGSTMQQEGRQYAVFQEVQADGGEELIGEMGYEPVRESSARYVEEQVDQGGSSSRRTYQQVRSTMPEHVSYERGMKSFVVESDQPRPRTEMGPMAQGPSQMSSSRRLRSSTQPPIAMQQIPMQNQGLGYRDYASALSQPLQTQKTTILLDRIRTLLREVRGNSDILNAVETIFSTILELGAVPGSAGRSRQFEASLLYADANRKASMVELQRFLERLAGKPLDRLIAIVDEFQIAYDQDWHLHNYLSEVGFFMARCFREPNYLDGSDFFPRATDLMLKGRTMFGMHYAQLTNDFLNEVMDIYELLSSNPNLNDIAFIGQRLFEDMFLDPHSGDITAKKSLLQDLRNVYLPIVMQSIRYLPLPRIEFTDDNWDIAMDNIIVASENIIPSLIEVKYENQLQVSPRPDLPDAYYLNVISIDIVQIQADIRNIEFAYRKKSFPRAEDSGLADLLIGGNGLSLHIKVAYDPNLWYTTLVPIDIDASIDSFTINFHDSGNDTLYKLAAPAVVSAVKRRVCRGIEEQIFNMIRRMDGLFTQAKN